MHNPEVCKTHFCKTIFIIIRCGYPKSSSAILLILLLREVKLKGQNLLTRDRNTNPHLHISTVQNNHHG